MDTEWDMPIERVLEYIKDVANPYGSARHFYIGSNKGRNGTE